jgi:predicted signal transduction protein with EAL and GGDEF domain
VVLLPETDAAGGAVVAERLGAAIRRTPVLARSARSPQPARIQVTVSIGVAVYPDHGATGAAVLEAADDALYQAKGGGRDGHRVARAKGEVAQGAAPRDQVTEGVVVRTVSGDAATVTSSGAPNGSQPPRARRGG